MRNLTLSINDPLQFESSYSLVGEDHMLFCPSEEPARVGASVTVKVVFRSGPQFFLSGVVMWRRPVSKGPQRLRPGVGVKLNPSEGSKVAYARGYARGGLLDKRAALRLPVRLRVTYRAPSGRRMNFTRNVTASGVLLNAAELLPVETSVQLSVVPPLDLPPVKLVGTVVRHVDDDQGHAMGIRLDFQSDAERNRFELLVKDIERAFRKGRLDEQYIAK